MSNDLDQYDSHTADWRNTLRQNSLRTYIVIFLFFAIYTGIGLLVDMLLYSSAYPQASMSDLFINIINFNLFPVATLIMLVIASLSLFVSYAFYDKLMLLGTDYKEITPETAVTVQEKQLYNTVEEMKIAAGLRFMPKVFIINADYMNAFASGYSEKSAMVAITRGLLEKLNRDEVQAVMAHELSHIRHMDIKLTLTASLLANMTIIVLDLLFYNAIYSGDRSSNSDNRSRNALFTIIMILRYTLPIISALLLLYLSRSRELMADAGCVQLMRNNEPLATALIKIQDDYTQNQQQYQAVAEQTSHENIRREAYIFDPAEANIKSLTAINDFFSTHPSLEDRLAAIGYRKK